MRPESLLRGGVVGTELGLPDLAESTFTHWSPLTGGFPVAFILFTAGSASGRPHWSLWEGECAIFPSACSLVLEGHVIWEQPLACLGVPDPHLCLFPRRQIYYWMILWYLSLGIVG